MASETPVLGPVFYLGHNRCRMEYLPRIKDHRGSDIFPGAKLIKTTIKAPMRLPSYLFILIVATATKASLQPRQSSSGISPVECALQGSSVQCCQTIEPFSEIASVLTPILQAAGIPLPSLDSTIAFNCQADPLALDCSQTLLCCSAVVPNQNIGVNCQPADPLLR
ncbi:hypothetical protein PNOK_0968200 [Pyrrhoderma noxium]|uniref:Hydrophobin n=1 Tax=Pyrrhoderma noxium TaxID=2282107 RepID=A0A286U4V9_9AGAM|nr:hypothetical protein PNOK_0968200 [Pyrrhoderma noxium]